MKFGRNDILFLVIPLLAILIIYPFLPTMVPRQFGIGGTISYMHKAFLFIVGVVPFIIYRYYRWKAKK